MPIAAPTAASSTKKKKPPASVAPTTMSVADLTDAANRMTLQDCSHVEVIGSTYPVIVGTWDNQDLNDTDSSDEDYEDNVYTMIRMIMHNGIDSNLIDPEWLDPYNLQLTIRWPKWFKKVSRHIAIQSGKNQQHQFGKDHAVLKTMRRYLRKLYKKDDEGNPLKEKIIEDTVVVQFSTPMNTDRGSVEIEVVDVTISAEDLSDKEQLPPGGIIKVLQIVAEAEMGSKKQTNKKIFVGGRKAALGKEPSGVRMDTSSTTGSFNEQQQQQQEKEQRSYLRRQQQRQQETCHLEIPRLLLVPPEEEQKERLRQQQQQQQQQAALVPFAPARRAYSTRSTATAAVAPATDAMDERGESRKRLRTHNAILPSP